ncbi:MAG: 23S rRNA pseudouridylate synthase B, partial [Gammaproteobacteria bacterium]|nr:23S rRNA pseudouridylate synthase B [Gammaproteobacteria bacterium]
MPERLQKWLAGQGLGSRRQMEGWIAAGRITVNGEVATLGAKVTGHEKITVDGRPL